MQSIQLPTRLKDFDSIALIGCRAKRIAYPTCEYNLFVLGSGRNFIEKVDKIYFQVQFFKRNQGSIIKNMRHILALNNARFIKDNKAELMMFCSSLEKIMNKMLAKQSMKLLFSSLSKIVRSELELELNRVQDASFWLASASFDLAEHELFKLKIIPSPSHLLQELRELKIDSYKDIVDAVDLSQASQPSIERKLFALERLSKSKLGIVQGKVDYLLKSHKIADAYFYLSHLLIREVEQKGNDIHLTIKQSWKGSTVASLMGLSADKVDVGRKVKVIESLVLNYLEEQSGF